MPQLVGGLEAPYENDGEMKNVGFELDLGYRSALGSKNRLGYNLGFNFTRILIMKSPNLGAVIRRTNCT